jgi:hypothetical protein
VIFPQTRVSAQVASVVDTTPARSITENIQQAIIPASIAAIPTRWRGFYFRSRMEARWAVFFDQLGVQFWYEPNGLRFDRVQYLPDYFLPDVDLYAEVKPVTLTPYEMAKAEGLCLHSRNSVLLLVGPPDFRGYDVIFVNPGDPYPTVTNASLDIDADGRKAYGRERRLFCSFDPSLYTKEDDFSERYREAVYASRAERFEEAA